MTRPLTQNRGGSEDAPRRAPVDARHLEVLARVLESFTETLDLDKLLRRVVTITREELHVDRAWILHPVSEDVELADVTYEATAPGWDGAFLKGIAIPLAGSRELIRRAAATPDPIIQFPDDPDADRALLESFHVNAQMLQHLTTRDGETWLFGLHQCEYRREFSDDDQLLFAEIGRYATLAIGNAQLHRNAVRETAKLGAILDQIPEAAAIYDAGGELELINRAAQKDRVFRFELAPAERLRVTRMRRPEGQPLTIDEMPVVLALHGTPVRTDVLVYDPRTQDDRIYHVSAAPIHDDAAHITGAVVIATDVTTDRRRVEREGRGRARAECLEGLIVSLMKVTETESNLDDAAEQIARAAVASVALYLYRPGEDQLELVGSSHDSPAGLAFVDYVTMNPFRAGEGLPGVVFQIGRPLLFTEVRGAAVVDFGRNAEEQELIRRLDEGSVIAAPVESYGTRVGSLVVSRPVDAMAFDSDEIDFIAVAAQRIGEWYHVQQLTTLAQEGHRAAEELARREVDARARLEAVLDSAPVGIAVVSADELRFELANERWIDYAVGLRHLPTDTAIVGRRVREVIPDLEEVVAAVAEKGETVFEEGIVVRDGSAVRYLDRIISPVRGRFSGETQNLLVLVQDVTEEVLTKRELQALARLMEERSARLDSILRSMADGLWVYDASGAVVDVNPAAVSLFGLGSRSEAIQHGSFEAFALRFPDGRPIPPEEMPFAKALRGEVVPDYLALARHQISGADIDVSIAAAPIVSNEVVGAVLVIRDISGLQELDRKKDEFLSVASHELRTPLTTIKGYAQLLAYAGADIPVDERGMHLQAMLGEIDRMMGLVAELLDVSRIETNRLDLHPQKVDWFEFVSRRVEAFRVQHPKREIRIENHADAALISVDVDRIRQVIDNIVANALKYSSRGVVIRLSRNGESLETSVIDEGIGIPPDELEELFERFHRARNVSSRYYGGLGLGLYIARAIVESHGGRIRVSSEEGKGSTFTIELPVGEG